MCMTVHRSTSEQSAPSSEVVEWRRACLVAAGFRTGLAADLAADCRIDLHAILELVDRGCPPHYAARILAPLDGMPRPC